MDNVDEQIAAAKEDLKGYFNEYDTEMSDGATLEFINSLPIVTAHADEIERRELAMAMLNADEAVINKHIAMYEEGLIRTPDGKWQYNPKEFKARKARRENLDKQLREKKISLDDYVAQISRQPATEAYDESAVANNPLLRRVKAIIQTRQDNQNLDRMIDDIENGDGVTKILSELAKEESKEATSDEAKEAARRESETLSFETAETPSTKPVEAISSPSEAISTEQPTITPKEKYERRKKRANENYKKRKKSLRDLRKNTYATIVPIPTPLLDLANYLIAKAEIGVYKIAQFAEELKSLAERKGFNANEFLTGIKAFYIDKTTAAIAENPDILENISSAKEIVGFHFTDPESF